MVAVTVQSGNDDYKGSSSNWEKGDPRNGDSAIGQFRDRCGAFVNNYWVQLFMSLVIVANAILLGVLTFDTVRSDPELENQLEAADLAMLSLFTLEITLQLIYLGPYLLFDGWLVFDFIVVFLSWAFMGSTVAVLRSFRIFRIFSLIARNKSMKKLFLAISGSLPGLLSICAVLFLFIYAFTVFFTGIFHDLYDRGALDWDYFGRLDYTFITLFQLMTLTSWLEPVRQVMAVYRGSWALFFLYVIITAIVMTNLIVAVVCESLVDAKDEAPAEEEEDAPFSIRESVLQRAMPGVEELTMQLEEALRSQAKMQKKLKSILTSLPPPPDKQ